jgi:hypothetical protein
MRGRLRGARDIDEATRRVERARFREGELVAHAKRVDLEAEALRLLARLGELIACTVRDGATGLDPADRNAIDSLRKVLRQLFEHLTLYRLGDPKAPTSSRTRSSGPPTGCGTSARTPTRCSRPVPNDVIEGYLGGGLPIIAATEIPVEISDLTDAKGLPTTWVLPASRREPPDVWHARGPHVEEETSRPSRLLVVRSGRRSRWPSRGSLLQRAAIAAPSIARPLREGGRCPDSRDSRGVR